MLVGLKKIGFLFIFFLIAFSSFSQDGSVLDKRKSIVFTDYSLENFLNSIEKEFDLRLSYSSLPSSNKKVDKTYSNRTLRYILEDVLREYQLYYQLLGEKSMVIQKYDPNKKGPYSFRGVLYDVESGNSLQDGIVYSFIENQSAYTNELGHFNINLSYLPQYLIFYVPGYEQFKLYVDGSDDYLFIDLKPNAPLEEIVVKNKSNSNITVEFKSSKTSIDVENISSIPSALSSTGVINSLKYSSGFQSAVEANNAMIVRGGNNDQNLILFDGVPVYNPLHVPGWFSVFNKNSIEGLDLMKGGIPAKYGGRLSSVIESNSKKGNLKKWHGGISLSPFSGEAFVHGPIIKKKLSFTLSGRRTFTDFLIANLQNSLFEESSNDFNLYFFDLNVGLHYRINTSQTLDVVSYFGGDRGYIRNTSSAAGVAAINEQNDNTLLWSNSLSAITYKNQMSKTWLGKFSAKYSTYGFNYSNKYQIEIQDPTSNYLKKNEVEHQDGISDFRVQADFEYLGIKDVKIESGLGYVNYEFIPANTKHLQIINDEALVDTSLQSSNLQAKETYAYVEGLFSRKNYSIRTGLRMVHFSSDQSYFYVEPRIKFTRLLGYKSHFYASYNLLKQNVYSITANEPGITYSIWLPLTDNMKPLQVHQAEVGYNKELFGNKISLSAYYKKFSQLPDFQTNVIEFLTDKELTIGSGEAKGVELNLGKQTKNWQYWIAYTLSKSTREFPEINGGKEYPFRFDRRHDLSMVGSIKLNKYWNMGLTWIYNSGNYVTLPVSRVILKINDDIFLVENFENRNNFQLPNYHRLDIGFNKQKKKKRGTQTWGFTIYNVYNQNNPYYVNLSFNEEGTPVLQQVNLLPFLPSLQYSFEF